MPEKTPGSAVPIPAGRADDLLATAARAPSILNTQPWLFRVSKYSIELYCDPSRRLRADPVGREMLISCGAALFGLRLAIRSLGYQPVVKLVPDPDRLRLLAEVRLGAELPMTELERRMLDALPHRHTHRGPFLPAPLPRGMLIGMQHDAVAEHAELALIDRPGAYEQLATIVARAARGQSVDSQTRSDARQWVRAPGNVARDGVPASAIPPQAGRQPGLLPQRDLDLGRHIGQLPPGGPPAAATAVLLTPGDTRTDWIRAGQALHRLLARAATRWVFATLNSQPLEEAATRELIRTRLTLSGAPQLLMQFGVARTAQATARRPPGDLIERDRSR
ncbi:MAG TPA: hypothetical protein VN840_03285 [Streptosporangiaceae bacterium]|nr:hypothetical protein [Streptosporangiaceae bacterium]